MASAAFFLCIVTTTWQSGVAKREVAEDDVPYDSSFELNQGPVPYGNSSLFFFEPNRKRSIKPRVTTEIRTKEIYPRHHASDGRRSMHGHVRTSNASMLGYHTARQSVTSSGSIIEKGGDPEEENDEDDDDTLYETLDEMQKTLEELTKKVKSDRKTFVIMLSFLCVTLLIVVAVAVWVLRFSFSSLLNSRSSDHSLQQEVTGRNSPAAGSLQEEVTVKKSSAKGSRPFSRVKSREWGRDSPERKPSDRHTERQPIAGLQDSMSSGRVSSSAASASSVASHSSGDSPHSHAASPASTRGSPPLFSPRRHESRDESFDWQSISIQGVDGTRRLFNWMPSKDAMTANLPLAARAFAKSQSFNIEDNTVERISPPWSLAHLESILKRNSINVSSWNAETRQHLVDELAAGRAMLVKQGVHMGLYCMIELVLVIVVQEDGTEVLVTDVANEFGDEVPCIMKQIDENVSDAAERCLREKLGGPPGSVKLDLGAVKMFEQEEHSAFYPGLVQICRKHITKGSVEGERKHELCPGNDRKYSLQWKPLSQVNSLYKHRTWLTKNSPRLNESPRAKGSGHNVSEKSPRGPLLSPGGGNTPRGFGRSISARKSIAATHNSREVVLPWTMEEVDALLNAHDIDAATLGRSSENLSQEASAGLFYFARFADEEYLFIARDVISLQVVSLRSKAMLVESFTEASQLRWPQEARLYHESIWETSRKLVRQQLMLEDDVLPILFDSEEVPLAFEKVQANRCNIVNRHSVVTADVDQGSSTLISTLNPPGFGSSPPSAVSMHKGQRSFGRVSTVRRESEINNPDVESL